MQLIRKLLKWWDSLCLRVVLSRIEMKAWKWYSDVILYIHTFRYSILHNHNCAGNIFLYDIIWIWKLNFENPRQEDLWQVWCWEILLRTPQIAKTTNKSLNKLIPQFSLRTQMNRFKLSYFWTYCGKKKLLGKVYSLGWIGRKERKW